MPNMSIAGYTFNLDPNSASWTCRLNTRSFDTYGGRVVQILSSRVENLVITGYITSKQPGWAVLDDYQWGAMEEFESAIRAIMEDEVASNSPSHFLYPELGWDAEVYVSGYSNVEYNPKSSVVSYTLALTVDSGLDTLADGSAAASDFTKVKDGVNWVRTKYNTPSGDKAELALKALEKALNTLDEFDANNEPDFYKLLDEVMKNPDDVGKKADTSGVGSADSAFASASASGDAVSLGDGGSYVCDNPTGGSVGLSAFKAIVNAGYEARSNYGKSEVKKITSTKRNMNGTVSDYVGKSPILVRTPTRDVFVKSTKNMANARL